MANPTETPIEDTPVLADAASNSPDELSSASEVKTQQTADPEETAIENVVETDDNSTIDQSIDQADNLSADSDESNPAGSSDPETPEITTSPEKLESSDRTKEIPALLEIDPPSDEIPESALDHEYVDDQPLHEDLLAIETADSTEQADNQFIAQQRIEPSKTTEEHAIIREDLKNIQESFQHSLANTQNIYLKLEAVANGTDELAQKINSIALNHELLTAEFETLNSGSHSKNVLSKSFLIVSSLSLSLLIIFQIYMFTSLIKTERLQNAAGASVLENITGLNKKLAEYTAKLSVPKEHPVAEAASQPLGSSPESAGHETVASKESTLPVAMPLQEKLNRLRNGQVEKKLIRKETGDWFVYAKKSEECVADVEIIEVLNSAYRKLGRPLTTKAPVPAHNSLCILKPDGKGGTAIEMTMNFVP
jgi:hypothetical protein